MPLNVNMGFYKMVFNKSVLICRKQMMVSFNFYDDVSKWFIVPEFIS